MVVKKCIKAKNFREICNKKTKKEIKKLNKKKKPDINVEELTASKSDKFSSWQYSMKYLYIKKSGRF